MIASSLAFAPFVNVSSAFRRSSRDRIASTAASGSALDSAAAKSRSRSNRNDATVRRGCAGSATATGVDAGSALISMVAPANGASRGISAASSALISPRSTSGNASRRANPRARIWSIRRGYCVQGPCFPHSPAFFASAVLNDCWMGAEPIRCASQNAVSSSPSPSNHSRMSWQCADWRHSPINASPQTDGRPLTMEMFCNDCIGARPSSLPI